MYLSTQHVRMEMPNLLSPKSLKIWIQNRPFSCTVLWPAHLNTTLSGRQWTFQQCSSITS